MKKLEIHVSDINLVDALLLNGENINFKKVSKREFVATVDVKEDPVLEMDNYHPLLVQNWWIKEMILFMVGIFGIFCPHYVKNDNIYHYKSVLKLENDFTSIKVRKSFENKAIDVQGCLTIDEQNERVKEPLIEKHRKTLWLSKFFFVFGQVLVALLVTVLIAFVF